ncbi:MAG TPA: hypothetical protein DDZ51_11640 [Planctomycetaceae bacterium]|nr:hypothetical protein [Planctomycetaceae bacterium]
MLKFCCHTKRNGPPVNILFKFFCQLGHMLSLGRQSVKRKRQRVAKFASHKLVSKMKLTYWKNKNCWEL